MQRLRAWLRANGFKIIRQAVGPEGIVLTVLAETGRAMQVVHRPGSDPLVVIESLESIVNRELVSTLV